MKISEMITDRYKLRIPPTVYYDLLADVQEMEEEQEPTAKNDLGVDYISRADVNRIICEYRDDATETGDERDLERAYGANAVGELISELPSVTPQEPILDKIRAEIERQEKWLMNTRYNQYNVDIAFDAIMLVVNKYKAESED